MAACFDQEQTLKDGASAATAHDPEKGVRFSEKIMRKQPH
jgi:hypothetical protein